jgi:predicted DNA-binding transcriptional regulator AlpA
MNKIILQSAGKKPDGTPIHPICDATGTSLPTLYRWEREGKFPARIRLGAKVGWDSQEVAAWLAARPRGPGAAPHRDAA